MKAPGGSGGDATVLREIEERVRARLAAVERENERLQGRIRLLGLGLLVTMAVLAVVAVAPDILAVVGLGGAGDVVEARGFRLMDANGVARGEWRVDDDGRARLSLLDQQSRQRLNAAVLPDGSPGLYLTNSRGVRRVVLGLLPDETATLVFADNDGTSRTILGMTSRSGSHLLLADADGAPRMGLVLDASGAGTTMLPDSVAAGDSESGDGGG